MFLSKTCVFPPGVTKLICDCKNANEHKFFKGQRARRSNVQVDSQSVICRHHSVFTDLLFTNSTMKLSTVVHKRRGNSHNHNWNCRARVLLCTSHWNVQYYSNLENGAASQPTKSIFLLAFAKSKMAAVSLDEKICLNSPKNATFALGNRIFWRSRTILFSLWPPFGRGRAHFRGTPNCKVRRNVAFPHGNGWVNLAKL